MGRSEVLVVIGCLCLVVGAGLFLFGGGEPNSNSGDPSVLSLGGSRSILVIVVGSNESVATVQRAVDPSRIVASTPSAFALREERLITASIEAVGAVLTEAGWGDRRLEILTPPRSVTRAQPSSEGGGEGSQLVDLLNKPTLTLVEAQRLLSAM